MKKTIYDVDQIYDNVFQIREILKDFLQRIELLEDERVKYLIEIRDLKQTLLEIQEKNKDHKYGTAVPDDSPF